MKLFTKKKWKPILLISIIIVIGLVAVREVMVMNQGPAAVETVDVEPKTFNMIEPASTTGINQMVENHYTSGSVNVNFTVSLLGFEDVASTGSSSKNVMADVGFSARILKGNVEYVNLSFNWSRANDTATVYMDPNLSVLENLTLTNMNANNTHDAAVSTIAGPNQNGCYARFRTYLVLSKDDVNDHQLNCTAELAYRDENARLRHVNVPINIGLFTKKNNDFNSAEEIGLGVYEPEPFRIILGGESDYCKLQIESGKSYNVTATATQNTGSGTTWLNLYLYDEAQGLLNSSQTLLLKPVAEAQIGPMTYSGYVYVRVECISGAGPYRLEVSQLESP
jgi:hypothetical protein